MTYDPNLGTVGGSPAARFVLMLAQVDPGPERLAQAAEVVAAEGVDWEEMAALATANGVAPLVYRHLRELEGAVGVSPAAMGDLAKSARGTEEHTQRLYRRLEELAPRLAEARVPVVALKGMGLGREVYGDPALRPMGDIDLLVPVGRLGALYGILTDLGYWTPTPLTEAPSWARLYRPHVTFYRPEWHGPPTCVEVHWALVQGTFERNLEQTLDEVWRDARPLAPGIEAMMTLSPAHHAIHVANHWVKHRAQHTVPLCDLNELLRRHGRGIDWAALAAFAQKLGVRPHVYCALMAAQRFLGTNVPEGALEALAPSAWRRACLRQLQSIPLQSPSERPAAHGGPHRLRYLLLELATRDSLAGMARVLRRAIWPDTRWLAERDRKRSTWTLQVRRMARIGGWLGNGALSQLRRRCRQSDIPEEPRTDSGRVSAKR